MPNAEDPGALVMQGTFNAGGPVTKRSVNRLRSAPKAACVRTLSPAVPRNFTFDRSSTTVSTVADKCGSATRLNSGAVAASRSPAT